MNKKKKASRSIAALTIVAMLAISLAPSPVFALYGSDPATPGALVNGDFEINTYPTTPGSYGVSVQGSTPPVPLHDTQANVSGWQTTEGDGNIELWSDGFKPASGNVNANNFGGITYYSNKNVGGSWFAEINASQSGEALYQDIHTIPGSLYEWYFDHRGRNGIDAAQMLLGNPDDTDPAGLLPNVQPYAQVPASQYYQGYQGFFFFDEGLLDSPPPLVGRFPTGYLDYPRPVLPGGTNLTASPTQPGGTAAITPWFYYWMMADKLPAWLSSTDFDGVTAPDPRTDHTVLLAGRGERDTGGSPAAGSDTNWARHKGFYLVPNTDELTRLEMYAEYSTYSNHSANSTGTAVGNLVDNVHFFPVAAPTLRVVYQGDEAPKADDMYLGYQLDPNFPDTPKLDNGMPVLRTDKEPTDGFVNIPDFKAKGTNVSSDGSGAASMNIGAPFVDFYGKDYQTVSSGGKEIVTADPGLYDIPVAIYNEDPYIAYKYVYNNYATPQNGIAPKSGALLRDSDSDPLNPGSIEDPNYPATSDFQYMGYAGAITSKILVLPRYTVGGYVDGLPGKNNSGVKIAYSYAYPLYDMEKGVPTGDHKTVSGTAVTDEKGHYSFIVPYGATVGYDTAPPRADTLSAAYSNVAVPANIDNLNFNALSVQYVDTDGNHLVAPANLGLFKSTDTYDAGAPAIGSVVTFNGQQYIYRGLAAGSDSAAGTMDAPRTVVMVHELVISDTPAPKSSGGSGGTVVVTSSPATGDTANPGLWLALLIVSVAAVVLIAALLLRRRQAHTGKPALKR